MNGVLPTLTWGTWDEASWRSSASATAATDASDASSDSDAAAAKSQRKLQRKGLRAPSQSQLWFDEVLARVDGSGSSGYRCNPLRCVHKRELHDEQHADGGIPWATLPDGIHPRDGKLPPLRARNKRLQVDNLAVFLRRMLRCA